MLIATSMLATAQDLAKPITYRTVAVPIHKALDEISAQTKLKLYASDELQDEPVILKLTHVSAQEFMDRFASIIGGEWTDRGKGEYEFARSDKVRAKLKADALLTQSKLIEGALKRAVEEVDKVSFDAKQAASLASSFAGAINLQKDGRPNFSVERKLIESAPDARLLARIVAQLDPMLIADLPPSGIVVVSNQPTKMQKEVVFNADKAAEQFVSEQNLLASAMSKAIETKSQEDLNVMAASPFRHIENAPTRFVVQASTSPFAPGTIDFALYGFDKSNRPIAFARKQLFINMKSTDDLMAERTKQIEASKNDESAPLSPASAGMWQHLRANMLHRGDPGPLPDSIRSLCLHPEEFDPIGFIASDLFLDVADADNLDEIVYPDDETILLTVLAAQTGEVKLSTLNSDLAIMSSGTLTKDDHFVTYTPKDRIRAWQERTNREVLGECLREADEKGFVSILNAGRLAMSERTIREKPMTVFVDFSYGRVYSPYYQRDKSGLRLYSSLTDDQRTHLSDGITAGMLTSEQYSLLQDLSYDGQRNWTWQWPAGMDPDLDHPDFVFQEAYLEPTEALPDGVPMSTKLQSFSKDAETYFCGIRSAGGSTYSQNMDLYGIASVMVEHQDYPQEFSGGEVLWIAPGHARTIDLRITYRSTLGQGRSLQEAARDGDTKWAMDALPSDIKKKLDEFMAQARVQMQTWHHEPTPTNKPPRRRV